jgi:uncharacterized protein YndB with AHSA1/START domain
MPVMREQLRSEKEVTIDVPLEAVWDYLMDISKIPEFHPRVSRVDLISGAAQKAKGVEYRCIITEGRGKGTCVEKVIDVVPDTSFVTTIASDSWGLSQLFDSYVVDTHIARVDESRTRVTIKQYFATRTLKSKLIALIAKPKLNRQTADTLRGIKQGVERDWASVPR